MVSAGDGDDRLFVAVLHADEDVPGDGVDHDLDLAGGPLEAAVEHRAGDGGVRAALDQAEAAREALEAGLASLRVVDGADELHEAELQELYRVSCILVSLFFYSKY